MQLSTDWRGFALSIMGVQQQGEGKESRGSGSRSSSVANEPETRLRGRLGGGQVARVRSESDLVTRVESEAALRLEEELKVSVRVESVAAATEKVEPRNSAKGKNGIGVTDNKQLDVELP